MGQAEKLQIDNFFPHIKIYDLPHLRVPRRAHDFGVGAIKEKVIHEIVDINPPAPERFLFDNLAFQLAFPIIVDETTVNRISVRIVG